MERSFIEKQWRTLFESARQNAEKLGTGCTEAAGRMMEAEVARFCEAAEPESKEDLSFAYVQRTALSARLTAIARADAMARAHPDAAESIHGEVAGFCEAEFPSGDEGFLARQRANLELNQRIADLCRSAP